MSTRGDVLVPPGHQVLQDLLTQRNLPLQQPVVAGDSQAYQADVLRPAGHHPDGRVLRMIGEEVALATEQHLLGQTLIPDGAVGSEPIDLVVAVHDDGAVGAGGHLAHRHSAPVEVVDQPGIHGASLEVVASTQLPVGVVAPRVHFLQNGLADDMRHAAGNLVHLFGDAELGKGDALHGQHYAVEQDEVGGQSEPLFVGVVLFLLGENFGLGSSHRVPDDLLGAGVDCVNPCDILLCHQLDYFAAAHWQLLEV